MNSLVFSSLQCVMPDNGEYFRPTPKQPKANELPLIVTDFRIAAHDAIKAGFDGVEITSANSYIIDQFLNDHVNNRIGENGGSIENRCRLALEIIGAVVEEIEADRVGVKHSLFSEVYGKKTRTQKFYWLIWRVNSLSSEFYIYMFKPRDEPRCLKSIRKAFEGTLIASGGCNKTEGDEAIAESYADFGLIWTFIFGKS